MGARLLSLLLLLGTAWPVSAQTSSGGDPAPETPATTEGRLEEWQRRRLERVQHLEPYRAGFLERTLLAIEKAERPSLLELNFKGLYPRVQSIASGSRVAAGARFWQPDIGASRWSVHGSAFYSLAGYQFYDLQVGRIPHQAGAFPARSVKGDDVYELGQLGRPASGRLILYASFRHEDYTQLDFFGLGPTSRPEDHTTFRWRGTSYELVAGYQLDPHLAVTLRTGLIQSTVRPGTDRALPTTEERFDEASAPGLEHPPDYLPLKAQLLLDLRDEPGNPHRGGMLALELSRFEDRGGDAFRFTRFAADARGYLPLGSPQRVLALRAYAGLDDAPAGSRVPFFMQEWLGGSHTLRGFESFRFRGEDLLLLQVEYRWEAAPALELALFADAGRVASKASDLGFSGLETDWGLGIRLKTFRAVFVRLDVAHSAEGTRALLRFNSSF